MRRAPDDRYVLGGLAAFVALLFADVLVAGRGFFARDLTFYHWPLKKIVRDVVLGGELPLWSRLIAAGQPLAANPAYEVWYPPQWLIFLPSYRLGFQLHIVLHVVVAACGAYLLLRQLRVAMLPALVGAVSFGTGGPLLSTATMLPFLFAWSWAPWIARFALRYDETRSRRDFALAAAALAMQVLIGEPTALLQTGAILAIFAVMRGPRRLVPLAALAATACAVAAIQLLPAIDFARDTVRAQPFPRELALAWTMPPRRLIEWLLPWPYGTPYGTELIASFYPGLVIAVSALAGFVRRVRGRLAVLAIVAIGIAVAAGPLFLFRSIRYPEKFILGPLFVLTLFGAVALDRFLDGRRAVFGVALLVLTIADLAPRTLTLMPRMPRDYFERPSIVAPLAGQPFRVAWESDPLRLQGLSPEERYRLLRAEAAPNLGAADGVAMAVSSDYDQTHLLVTRALEIAALRNRPVVDAWSNVGARVVNGRIETTPDSLPRYRFASDVIRAEGEMNDPRAAYVRAPPFRPAPGEVRRVVERANSADLDIATSGPSVLLASVTADRHWHASIDGREVPIVRANVAFQAIRVPPGAHRVRFEYRSPLVWVGAAISLLAIVALVITARSG